MLAMSIAYIASGDGRPGLLVARRRMASRRFWRRRPARGLVAIRECIVGDCENDPEIDERTGKPTALCADHRWVRA